MAVRTQEPACAAASAGTLRLCFSAQSRGQRRDMEDPRYTPVDLWTGGPTDSEADRGSSKALNAVVRVVRVVIFSLLL